MHGFEARIIRKLPVLVAVLSVFFLLALAPILPAEAGVLQDNYDSIMQEIQNAGIVVTAPEQEVKDWLVEMELYLSRHIWNSENVRKNVVNGIMNTLRATYNSGPYAGEYKYPNLRPDFYNSDLDLLLERAGTIAVEIKSLILGEAIATGVVKPGLYYSPVDVELRTITTGATVFYTLDGSTPTTSSLIYTIDSPIRIEHTTTVKAIAWMDGTSGGTTDIGEFTYQIGPSVQSVLPQGQTVLPGDFRDIEIFFSTEMNWTGQQDLITLTDREERSVPGTASYSQAERKAVFTSNEPLEFGAAYTAKVSGTLCNTDNIPLQNDYTWSFTTAQASLEVSIKEGYRQGEQLRFSGSASAGGQPLAGEDIRVLLTGPTGVPAEYQVTTGAQGVFEFVYDTDVGSLPGVYTIDFFLRGDIVGTSQFELIEPSPPEVDLQPGVYYEEKSVALHSWLAGADIYYTVDGTDPAKYGTRYSDEVTIARSCTLKAAVFKKGVWGDAKEFIYKIGPVVMTGISSPAAGEEGVSIHAGVSAVFSQDVDPATLQQCFYVLDSEKAAVSGTVYYDTNERKAVFEPENKLVFNSDYQVCLSKDIKGADGTPLDKDYSWTFKTEFRAPETLVIQSSVPESIYTGDRFPFNWLNVSGKDQNGDPIDIDSGEITWRSLNHDVIDVDEAEGQLIARGGGEAGIYAQLVNNSNVKSDVFCVRVLYPARVQGYGLLDKDGLSTNSARAGGYYYIKADLQSERDRLSPLLVMQVKDNDGNVVKFASFRSIIEPGTGGGLEASSGFRLPEKPGAYTVEFYLWDKWLSELEPGEWRSDLAPVNSFRFDAVL